MSLVKKARRVGESVLLGLGFLLIPFLTRRMVVGLSVAFGRLAFRVSRKLRDVALANLRLAFGSELSDTDRARIARESFEIMSLVVLDLLWFSFFSRRRLTAYVEFDPSFHHYFDTRPAIAVTGHFGNWEIMGQAGALRGHPCVTPAAPIKNKFVDKVIRRRRGATGLELTSQRGAVRAMLRTLRDGGRTALIMDQNTLPEQGGEFVQFFGRPVPVSGAAGLLSKHTGADIVFVYCILEPGGRYCLHATPVRRQEAGETGVTQRITAMLEDVIRERPGHWLWMYKRWKYVPDGVPADGYPFYARRKNT
ncbi:lysophospholipid acyltransferase family protein [Verrucomicrobiota bacterium]